MRIGLIADIHGNTVALEAVLADIAQQRVDLVLCLGDLAANGPDPIGAIDRIAEVGCPILMGNTDADLIDMPDWWQDPGAVGAPESTKRIIEISRWCANQLDARHQEFLAALPPTIELSLGDAGTLLAFHGSPRSATDAITATTTPSELDQMLDGFEQPILAGAHTHVPMIRHHQSQMIINPGSVGLPFATYGFVGDVAVPNHAAYGLLTTGAGQCNADLRPIPIDPTDLSRQVASTDMPHSQWWLNLRS